MAEFDHPGFRRLATDEDDSRWLADQAALQRKAAARRARSSPTLAWDAPAADGPVLQARLLPALIEGGLVAAAVILTVPLLLPHAGPARAMLKAGLKPARGELASASNTPGVSLPCYVDGVSLGVLPLVDCAEREGRASDKLRAERARLSRESVSGTAESGHALAQRARAQEPSFPPLVRLAAASPAPTRALPPFPRVDAPPRTRPPPSVDDSVPYADRLDDAALADVDARPEP